MLDLRDNQPHSRNVYCSTCERALTLSKENNPTTLLERLLEGGGKDEAGQEGAGRQWSADDSREAQRALAEEWRSARETAQ